MNLYYAMCNIFITKKVATGERSYVFIKLQTLCQVRVMIKHHKSRIHAAEMKTGLGMMILEKVRSAVCF